MARKIASSQVGFCHLDTFAIERVPKIAKLWHHRGATIVIGNYWRMWHVFNGEKTSSFRCIFSPLKTHHNRHSTVVPNFGDWQSWSGLKGDCGTLSMAKNMHIDNETPVHLMHIFRHWKCATVAIIPDHKCGDWQFRSRLNANCGDIFAFQSDNCRNPITSICIWGVPKTTNRTNSTYHKQTPPWNPKPPLLDEQLTRQTTLHMDMNMKPKQTINRNGHWAKHSFLDLNKHNKQGTSTTMHMWRLNHNKP